MIWQTDMTDWLPLPWSCENMHLDKQVDRQFFEEREEDDEYAFYCKHFPAYRILTSECLGMECPDCKIHHHDDFVRMIKEDA